MTGENTDAEPPEKLFYHERDFDPKGCRSGCLWLVAATVVLWGGLMLLIKWLMA